MRGEKVLEFIERDEDIWAGTLEKKLNSRDYVDHKCSPIELG